MLLATNFVGRVTVEYIILTVECVLSLVDLFICFGYTIVDFLRDVRFKSVKSFLGVCELRAVTISHGIDLSFKFFAEDAQLVLKLGAEGLKSVIDSFLFGFGEVAIRLNLALNVLELGLELLFGLDAFHEHYIVVAVHLDQLVVH